MRMQCKLGSTRVISLLPIMLAISILPGVVFGAESKEAALPGLDAVIRELRQGGLVIYFRHGPTDQAGPKEDQVDLSNCDTQRNLSPMGRSQAVQIGNAMRSLDIPVGTVITSPFCRAKEMGQLAFGKFFISNDLYFALNVNAEETTRLNGALRKMLSSRPAGMTNTVLIAHTANLREATGIWPKPEGVAYIFRPLPDGLFEPVAKVMPDDWLAAAKRK